MMMSFVEMEKSRVKNWFCIEHIKFKMTASGPKSNIDSFFLVILCLFSLGYYLTVRQKKNKNLDSWLLFHSLLLLSTNLICPQQLLT